MSEIATARARAKAALAGYAGRWWIGGGWSIDAWIGAPTREHHDLDIVVLRTELSEVRDHLGAWTIWINEPDRFLEWDGDELQVGDDCLLARPHDGRTLSWSEFAEHPAAVELMLEQTDGDTWVYRRDHRVRDSLRRLGASGDFLAPEVALLYKAPQHAVERNAADFTAVLPHLDPSRRAWLEQALRLAHPGHPWLTDLVRGGSGRANTRTGGG